MGEPDNLRQIAENARNYAETEQHREFNLDGACHENAIGAGDYIRFETAFNPIIVWGAIRRDRNRSPPDTLEEAEERGTTHFWVELDSVSNSVIDIFALPREWSSSEISRGDIYCGSLPKEYVELRKTQYYGRLSPFDLLSPDSFKSKDL